MKTNLDVAVTVFMTAFFIVLVVFELLWLPAFEVADPFLVDKTGEWVKLWEVWQIAGEESELACASLRDGTECHNWGHFFETLLHDLTQNGIAKLLIMCGISLLTTLIFIDMGLRRLWNALARTNGYVPTIRDFALVAALALAAAFFPAALL